MIYQCPNCSSKFQADNPGLVACPSCDARVRVEAPVFEGSAWDRAQKGGWINAFIETIRRALTEPVQFFSDVAAGAGYVRPAVFAMIVYAIVYASAMAYQAGFQGLAMSLDMGSALKNAFVPALALSVPLYIMIAVAVLVVAVPVFTIIILFFHTAVVHLCLVIVGGVGRDFWATFRTICYSASPQVLGVVPFLGGIVAPIWQIVLLIIGLKVAHNTTYGKSALAVFLPLFICCGAAILVAIAIAGGATGALIKH